jgi:cystathionine beta-lyase/cystathionine gamma-synthase
MEFETRAIHTGQEPDPSTGATIPPLYLSTTYTQRALGEHLGYDYSRSGNPTRDGLESCLASLEGGEACAAFASGLAACSSILDTLQPGEGVVASHDLYGGTFRLLDKVFRPLGVEVAFAQAGTVESFAQAIATLRKPRLLWVESPTNPLLDVVDIAALSALARARGLLVAVDNTFATPWLQKPLSLGADYVAHSTTKYLGGHSDVIGGAVIARSKELLERVRFLQNARGAVPGPLDCYLVQRGVKTLALRMERHCSNAATLAELLQGHPHVKKVIYPGLPAHPGHAVARQQMRAFGGMLSFELHGGLEAARHFATSLRVFSLAESLGGVESLCCHPATMTHASIPREVREAHGVNNGLLRLSAGLENIKDLQEDVLQALDTIGDQGNADA